MPVRDALAPSFALAREGIGDADREGSDGRWVDALQGLALLAANAPGIRALRLVAGAGPVRDAWLAGYRASSSGPCVDVPASVDAEALAGGLDIEATLTTGRPVRSAGLIDRASGGTLVLRDAERAPRDALALVAAAIDAGDVRVVALDGGEPDDAFPPTLSERCAVTLDLRAVSWRDAVGSLLPSVGDGSSEIDAVTLETLDAVSRALPGTSIRRTLHLVALTRALAADTVGRDDILAALRLHLGVSPDVDRRAAEGPAEGALADEGGAPDEADGGDRTDPRPTAANDDVPPTEPNDRRPDDAGDGAHAGDRGESRADAPPSAPEEIAAALVAALPPGMLDGVGGRGGDGRGAGAAGRATGARGRPAGVGRRADYPGARPSILPTLRAAVPWQRARGRGAGEPIAVRPSDLRYARRVRPAGTTIVFAVDASGSAARERLAEAKGAVEALLGEAYVRRDKVALIAFRGGRADLLLPPTRGLVTARRALGAVPGGGATPLAAGLLRGVETCRAARSSGERALLVVLTDGRGNVALDGTTGRQAARADEDAATAAIRSAELDAILIDTAARPGRHAPALAERMGARLLVMPRAGGVEWAAAVSDHLAP